MRQTRRCPAAHTRWGTGLVDQDRRLL